MSFTSFVFVAFFLLVYGGYWLLHRRYRAQNALLLVASYVFYGWWDWRFCSLLLISTVVDYQVGRWMVRTDDARRRKLLVALSCTVNLSILGFFKYFNFFAESAVTALNAVGLTADPVTLNVVLPVGISFYTFQTMSYTIDLYRGKIEPVRDLLDFGLYVSFFPQLVAGPIERASHLLPQLSKPRRVHAEEVNAGLFLILWGYFKKLVIADNVAMIVNEVYATHTEQSGFSLVLGTVAFAFQIYCDFSAYSDIARGAAKLLGIDLMVNFRLPYFATSPSDFWQRWHISLSTWLRDYLYIPLGGNRHGRASTLCNLMTTMLLGGLWHGAAWTFVAWGAFHGLILIIYRMIDGDRPAPRAVGFTGTTVVGVRMAIMFVLTLIGWVLFRAESLDQAWYIITHASFEFGEPTRAQMYDLLFFITPLVLIQIAQQRSGDLLIPTKLPFVPRVLLYAWLLVWISIFGVRESIEFIYFQF
ncbi:MAG: MBOAT family O-acyltransferase [Phycisphaeraceae bacterium]